MTKFYATRDSDGLFISQDADIRAFNSREDAVQYLLSSYGSEWNKDGVVIEAGSFGDCWTKSHEAPRVGGHRFSPFSYTQLIIQRPGQHPGGKMFWTTPSPDVLVVSRIDEIEE
jgi:hypothetical protein